jgi:tetratricopeptide (TPR) repeat protein
MFDEADEQLSIAAAADEERQAAVLESWGLQMFMAGEYARAAKIFQRAIDEKVAARFNADFYYYLAAALEFDGKTDEALEAARKASEEKPESPRYASRYAWVLYHAKRYAEAEREYLQILEKYDADHADEDVRDVVRETRMILSNIAIHLERMPEAEEWLEQVLDEYPEDIGAQNDLGYLWTDQNKHLKRSLRMIETAVAHEPDNAAYRDSLGWAHFRLGNYEEAIKQLEQAAAAIEETPDGVIMDHLGDAYFAAGRKQDAAKAWRQAIELFEKDDDAEQAMKTRKKLDALND